MTSRERLRVAMDLGVPDRVPFMCQLSVGHMLLQLGVSPVEFWNDAEVFARGLADLRAQYDFDGVLVSLHGHDPEWRKHIRTRTWSREGELVEYNEGTRMLYPSNELPQPLATGAQHHPVTADVSSISLPDTLSYIPVSQGLHFAIHRDHRFDIFRLVRRLVGPDFAVHGEVTSPFDYFLDYFGHEQALMYLIDHPTQSKFILNHFATLVAHLASAMCEEDIDAVKISSPFAGAGFISLNFYREFVLPYERRIAHAVRQKGKHVYTHTCGLIGDRLEAMFEAGVSGIECLDPPPIGNVELEEAKERTRGKGFLKGNVDSVRLLTAREDEILSDARRRVEVGKKGGGFIFSTACSVAPRVEPHKLFLLREAVEQWGRP
jgi:hypothetical protein